MARIITINRPEVVALVEAAASRLTHGDKTEAVRLAMTHLLASHERVGSLFGAHPGSVRVMPGGDLTQPTLDVIPDAESGAEMVH